MDHVRTFTIKARQHGIYYNFNIDFGITIFKPLHVFYGRVLRVLETENVLNGAFIVLLHPALEVLLKLKIQVFYRVYNAYRVIHIVPPGLYGPHGPPEMHSNENQLRNPERAEQYAYGNIKIHHTKCSSAPYYSTGRPYQTY